ncbi:DsbA family protein [Spongiibacter sp.]|uniref:DsbA family protein n=1 Tax=Spongiibacter sp. TaxID=2024860 RepID=UPI003562F00F
MNPLMPYLARMLASRQLKRVKRAVIEARRRLARQPHRLDVFIRVDDPYSYLLMQVMAEFCQRFSLQPHWHCILESPVDMYPEQAMWRDYAVRDAAQLAALYQLDFPASPADLSQAAIASAASQLLDCPPEAFASRASTILACMWRGEGGPSPRELGAAQRVQLEKNQRYLQRLGHYAGAMIHYSGEWYWGIDRLDHLEHRLIDLGAARRSGERAYFTRGYATFCRGQAIDVTAPQCPLVLYWSARSPYSYLALVRASQLAQHYNIALHIKPVLPMLMRGMAVPTQKKMYIFHDTKREADKLGIPYGFVADPLGRAVERCYALCGYAETQGLLQDYLLSFARAVNAEGIRADSDRGLRKIVERCGLDWQRAKNLLADDSWRDWAQKNLEEMYAMGCWGVPSFRYGELTLWGQDRLGMVERAMLSSPSVHRC